MKLEDHWLAVLRAARRRANLEQPFPSRYLVVLNERSFQEFDDELRREDLEHATIRHPNVVVWGINWEGMEVRCVPNAEVEMFLVLTHAGEPLATYDVARIR